VQISNGFEDASLLGICALEVIGDQFKKIVSPLLQRSLLVSCTRSETTLQLLSPLSLEVCLLTDLSDLVISILICFACLHLQSRNLESQVFVGKNLFFFSFDQSFNSRSTPTGSNSKH